MAEKQEAEVLFEYEKTQEDELNLKVGQIIQDVVQVDEGWCEGTLNGVRGMFPDNFVKLRPAQATPAAPKREGGGGIKTRRAKVAFSYAAENPDELSLEPGQLVEILGEDEEGWFRGRLGDKEGVFPSNFLDLSGTAAPEPAKAEEPPAQKQPVIGHKLFPSINPALARAQLKPSQFSTEKKAPPPVPPPAAAADKSVQRAKVTFDYDADNVDELTIKMGDVLDVLEKDTGQDGWWKVKLGDKVGLVPDNFVEVLQPTSAPTQPPPSVKPKAPPSVPSEHKPPPKETPSKPPPPRSGSVSRPAPPSQPERPPAEHKPPQVMEEPAEENSDFGVPHTDPLDSSAMKDRPKRTSRPPSRSNLQTGEGNEPSPEPKPEKPQSAGLSPWQAELQKRKANKPPAPTPGSRPPTAPKKAVKPPEKPATKPPGTKPQPSTRPPVEPAPPPTRDTPSPHQPPVSPTPPPANTASPPDNSWREAYEKLRDDFDTFKAHVEKQFAILTSDLDDERKHWRGLEVDIDRLKKQSK